MLHVVAMAVWDWKVAAVLALIDISAVAMLRLLRSFKAMPVTLAGRP